MPSGSRSVLCIAMLSVMRSCHYRVAAFLPRPFRLGAASVFSQTTSRKMTAGPPMEPKNFGQDFRIEPFTSKLDLETFNAHPLDKSVTFDEVDHCYYLDGVKMKQSVTTLVGSFFDSFEPEVVVDKMMSGANWPRPGYLKQGTDNVPMSREEVLRKWDIQGRYARNAGTWVHHNIERYFNNMETSPNLPEMKSFLNFEKIHISGRKITPIRTEWRIAGSAENVGGTVDFVGQKPDGTYVLIDWKTTKGLAAKMADSFGKKAKDPLSHLDNCDGSKYSIQLNIYRYILQKYYGLVISELHLASFNRSEPEYFTTAVPIMDADMKLIFG